ncbi:MAG: hypothetical protein C9356_19535 [Oleiphilus sp.]|nr:MAG: hypothetical protein C9356_19535 [Oleiphilus sp.]
MKNLQQQLTQYARYHRDPRNIATHFVGIPMIVVALSILLSRPGFEVMGVWLSPAAIVLALSVIYYFMLDLSFGLIMAVLYALTGWAGALFASAPFYEWLSWGVGLFLIGWVFQFIGHYYEGKKPAFVDDLIGLAIGPLFVVAEAVFALGLKSSLNKEIEAEAGPIEVQRKSSELTS